MTGRTDPDRRRDARRRGSGDRRRHAGRDFDGARRHRRRRGDLALCRAAAGSGPVRPRQQWRRRLCHRPRARRARRRRSASRPWPSRGAPPPARRGIAGTDRSSRWRRRAAGAAADRRLFGTGLARPLDESVVGPLAASWRRPARVRVAVDLPSGVATDDGAILSPVPDYDLTITFQTLKPSHLLQPAARHMGRIVVADIGIEAESRLHEIARPRLAAPGAGRPQIYARLCRRDRRRACRARARWPRPRRCGPAPALCGCRRECSCRACRRP